MKKLITILFLFIVFFAQAQWDVPPTGSNFKSIQTPYFRYYTPDSTNWLNKGATYGWAKLITAKQVQHKIDSLKATISSGATPIDDLLKWNGTAYTPYNGIQTGLRDNYTPYFMKGFVTTSSMDADLSLAGELIAGGFIVAEVGYESNPFLQAAQMQPGQFRTQGTASGQLMNGSYYFFGNYLDVISATYDTLFSFSMFRDRNTAYPFMPTISSRKVANGTEQTWEPLTIKASEIYFPEGTASKYMALDSNNKLVYLDGGGAINDTIQALAGTTVAWNLARGRHATITLSGNTTITLSNATSALTGNLKVTNSSTAYTLTFAGYTNLIHNSVQAASNRVITSGGSLIDMFSYFYSPSTMIWNGGNDYK